MHSWDLARATGQQPDLDRAVLVERHLVSKELASGQAGAAVISRDQTCSVMINEEDHLRMQAIRAGLQLHEVYAMINTTDSELEGDGYRGPYSMTFGNREQKLWMAIQDGPDKGIELLGTLLGTNTLGLFASGPGAVRHHATERGLREAAGDGVADKQLPQRAHRTAERQTRRHH